ncbi:MAG: RagB/SusD family nutrient uptake outer membrane protein [Gemmatimonadota bacterium]
MAIRRSIPALFAVLAIGGLNACEALEAPDFNNPSAEELEESPTRSGAVAGATGLLIGARENIARFNGYVSLLGILGRESYNLDGADTRFITQMLGVDGLQLDPGARALGGNLWRERYQNIRNANILLAALDALPDAPPDGMTPEEKEATRGFAKTMQALDFLLIINARNDNGAPIDVDRPLSDPPAPFVTKQEVFARIVELLEEAKGNLAAGGSVFPFPLSSGFAGFDTPATFLLFNRALLGRVEVYRMEFDAAAASRALDALGESFLDEGASLDLGVYHVFGTGSGDALSQLVDPDLFAHISIRADAQLQENGVDPDARFLRKVGPAPDPRTLLGVFSDLRFDPLYPSPTSPVPIIRNEELILLRAEANIGLGNISDAADDINFIRTTSGGLPERNDLDASNILDELLYNKRYSLLFEGGHRWIDMRRHGRLNQLPLDQPNHTIHSEFPIPVDETNARQ